MSKGKFTKGKWNLHVREMTDTGGETFRKCFIENGGTALAQFANFGDENEANENWISATPELLECLKMLYAIPTVIIGEVVATSSVKHGGARTVDTCTEQK